MHSSTKQEKLRIDVSHSVYRPTIRRLDDELKIVICKAKDECYRSLYQYGLLKLMLTRNSAVAVIVDRTASTIS